MVDKFATREFLLVRATAMVFLKSRLLRDSFLDLVSLGIGGRATGPLRSETVLSLSCKDAVGTANQDSVRLLRSRTRVVSALQLSEMATETFSKSHLRTNTTSSRRMTQRGVLQALTVMTGNPW